MGLQVHSPPLKNHGQVTPLLDFQDDEAAQTPLAASVPEQTRNPPKATFLEFLKAFVRNATIYILAYIYCLETGTLDAQLKRAVVFMGLPLGFRIVWGIVPCNMWLLNAPCRLLQDSTEKEPSQNQEFILEVYEDLHP